ncbi:SusD/RagB family nutrient-binding outer membrane lipoprotein [Prevotella sp.]|uniref:SusD/RagB family nutrient-binding outer membrane lipoprotein n=1 Tax=Prevotella sp. TaxID=59823 RepID=UPI002F94E687
MKRLINIFSLLVILLFGLSSCDDFGNLNEDPTKSTNMDPNLLLPNLQLSLTNDYQEWHRHFMYPGGWVQQWCGDWGTTEYGCLAIKNDAYMAELWLRRYSRLSKDLSDIVERTAENPAQANINAIGRIMNVYVYNQLTDMYGDIPYFDAGKGYYSNTYKPKYDLQKDIYDDFFKQLDIANGALNEGGDAITYDHYFNGDIKKWKRYCNSLRLRLALRLVKVDPERAKEEARKAIANGVMQSNDDICLIKYENVANPSEGPGRGNALSNRFQAEPRNFRFSRRLITYMEQTRDPRITQMGRCYLADNETDVTDALYKEFGTYERMARPTDRFDWENYEDINQPDLAVTVKVAGVDTQIEPKYQYLQPAKWLQAYSCPYINMSYAEVELLQAECAVRWGIGGNASEHFTKALHAAVEQMTLYGAPAATDADVQKFVEANTLQSGKELEQINMQLWVLNVFNPFESFANWRRTNIPNIVFNNYDSARNQSNGKTPRRLLYPVEEQVKNGDNYAEAISRVPGYDWTIGVWWDK